MIEVLNIVPVRKGVVLAKCDIYIIPWHFTLHEVTIFEKGANRWVSLPSKEWDNEMGERKYKPMVSFDSDAITNRFRNQVMGAVDKFLAENPDMKQEDVVKEGGIYPF